MEFVALCGALLNRHSGSGLEQHTGKVKKNYKLIDIRIRKKCSFLSVQVKDLRAFGVAQKSPEKKTLNLESL